MFPAITADGPGGTIHDPKIVSSTNPPFLREFGGNIMEGNTYGAGVIGLSVATSSISRTLVKPVTATLPRDFAVLVPWPGPTFLLIS